MCGRYYLKISIDKLLERYGILNYKIDFPSDKEIFPSQEAPIIIYKEQAKAQLARWGFIPSFQNRLIINARAESITERKTFKGPFKEQRCIIPVSAFFEWSQEGKNKVKHKIFIKDLEVFSLAGLYKFFPDKQGNLSINFVIITTEANDKIKKIHKRMPVILNKDNEQDWIKPNFSDQEKLKKFLKPYPGDNIILQREDKQLGFQFS